MEYNHETHTVYTVIDTPFYSAGKKLGWPSNDPGLGINRHIIAFILKTDSNLIVKVSSTSHTYWIPKDKLREWLKRQDCDYTISGVNLKVISFKLFIRFVEHSEV